MKILLDQNISHRIVPKLEHVYKDVKQVRELDLENIEDSTIWDFAKANGYSIVTFDSDYFDLCNVRGFPPKIIWLRMGNTQTEELANVLIKNHQLIQNFIASSDYGCLELDRLG